LRVLGIDPGSRATGWGLVAGASGSPQLIDCGVIRLDAAEDLAERMATLHAELERLLGGLAPAVAAVESPFHGANARAALQLAHARGVALAVLALGGVTVVEYAPATVKAAVTGNGRATKDQVQRMVWRLLGQPVVREPSLDASDALAVAVCHASTMRATAAVTSAVDREQARRSTFVGAPRRAARGVAGRSAGGSRRPGS
jgi:crossover junction endodeoxyribonuclease RuvC